MTRNVALSEDLQRRRSEQLYRRRLTLHSSQGIDVCIGQTTYLSFCSNDYLGLASHPDVVTALQHGAERWGVGAGASHLVTGHMRPHQTLEEKLADWLGVPKVLCFSTGYMANLALVQTFTKRGDLLLGDRLNHASLVDAGLMSRARFVRYRHCDIEKVRELVISAQGKNSLIATDGVFSMDGDIAPIKELSKLANSNSSRLLVDDAHGLGVLGTHGLGTLEHLDVRLESPVILMGTLGKAFGTFGAFVAAEEEVIETLIQRGRAYIYTTALPPGIAQASSAALEIVRVESWRRENLRQLIDRFSRGAVQQGLSLLPSHTPIQPIIIGSATAALRASDELKARGILVTPIRPPTVPEGTSRLRVTLCATHTEQHVDQLLEALGSIDLDDS